VTLVFLGVKCDFADRRHLTFSGFAYLHRKKRTMKKFLQELVEIIDTTLMLIGVFGFFAAVVVFLYKIAA